MSCLLSTLLSVVVLTAAAAAAVSEAQYDDFTPAPDYDADYNATFEYSFYSNTSSDDLDLFSEHFIEGDEDQEDTGGPGTTPTQQQAEDVSATVATTRPTTEQSRVGVRSAASLPVSLELRTLIWTLMILILISHQLQQHTL